jgi:hypothetical protein
VAILKKTLRWLSQVTNRSTRVATALESAKESDDPAGEVQDALPGLSRLQSGAPMYDTPEEAKEAANSDKKIADTFFRRNIVKYVTEDSP